MEEQIKIVKGNITGEDSTYIRRGTGNIEFDSNTHKILLDGVNYSGDTLIETTYSELRDLRDNKLLIPGCWYRITDYTCTTTQEDTRAVHNNFDIIVLALSNDTLSEEARAIMHLESQSEIEAQIQGKDGFETNSVRFNDSVIKTCYVYSENGGNTWNFIDVDTLLGIYGVNRSDIIFYPDPYDPVWVNSHSSKDLVTKYGYFSNSKLEAWKIWYCLENNKVKYCWADTTNGKGVIYRMIDEWGNDVCYDFKNIQFKRKLTNGQYDPINGTDTWVYTFNAILAGTQSDNSLGLNLALAGGSGIVTACAENIIKPDYDYTNQTSIFGGQGEIALNNNVFLCNASSLAQIQSLFVYANKFDVGSSGNTFKDTTAENIFGTACMNNIFDNNCIANIIGNAFQDNTIENSFLENVVGNNIKNCQFNWCSSNKFGNNIKNCQFGNPDGRVNSSDSAFYGSTIGNNCDDLSLIGDVVNFTIGNGVYNFYTTEITMMNVIVENGVSYVTLDCPSSDSYTKWCQNITIALGVSGTSTAQKTISHPTVNDTFQTIYRPANSQIVSV